MNAGAYGREMTDVVIAAEALDASGRLHRLDNKALGFSYRHSDVPEDWIFTGARAARPSAASAAAIQRPPGRDPGRARGEPADPHAAPAAAPSPIRPATRPGS